MEDWDWLHTNNHFRSGARGIGVAQGLGNMKKPIFDIEIFEEEKYIRLIYNSKNIDDEFRMVLQILIYKLHFFAFKKQNKGISFYFNYGNHCFQVLYKSKTIIQIYKEEMKQCLLLEKHKSL